MILKPNKGDYVYYAHYIPKFNIYQNMHMKCRTVFNDCVVICNKNIAYLIKEDEYERLFVSSKACQQYLDEQKEIHKDEKIYSLTDSDLEE